MPGQEVALGGLQDAEGGGGVVVLQNALVVVLQANATIDQCTPEPPQTLCLKVLSLINPSMPHTEALSIQHELGFQDDENC